ncbi:FabD/lysophospholipase-like protein [Mycena olivaceomarginata]|nr:FabD/lysophospholipase-like protein [Mycena olivaceomarginata]
MLLILEHLMYKLKVAENLPDIPHPCNYFDLIGGTSTGGLIALMLGRLRMSIADSKEAYGRLAKEVFSDVKFQGSDGKFKASKLEKAIKQIVKTYSASHNPEDRLEDIQDNACKMFVCAMNAANMSLPVLFRTYNTLDYPAMDCTIWQAGRATTAAPTFFKLIKIGLSGIEEAFVDGGIGHNNPTASLLSEAKILFPHHQIACIISLGTGQPHTISIPKPSLLSHFLPLDVVKAIQGIATDCEKEHQSFAHHFEGIANLYFRFNVEQGMQNIQLNQWERLGDVAANTRQYIQSQPVTNQLANAAMSLSDRIGKVSTSGLAPMPTAIEIGLSQVATLARCPPPSQIFQGRQDILAKMDDYFSKDIGKRHVYVLHGLGGSGKTQIALKFLDITNQHLTPRFTKQFFINAGSLQALDTSFKNIAIANKIGNNLQDALLWLITITEEWMLLFDNADDPNINLFPFFPQCTHGNIIITSRNPQLAVHGPKSYSKVGNMKETDAIDLLLLSAVEDNTVETAESASEIVKELYYLPLAIIQAGAYISKFNCLDQYLSLYKENHVRLLKQHPEQSHDDYEWTVYTTWEISFKQLSPLAAELLQMCSLLHYNNIPEAIFQKAAEWTIDDAADAQNLHEARAFLQSFLSMSANWDQQAFMDIIAEIAGYSLLNRHAGGILSIHPLVQLWCCNTFTNEHKVRECMIDILGMSVRFTADDLLLELG